MRQYTAKLIEDPRQRPSSNNDMCDVGEAIFGSVCRRIPKAPRHILDEPMDSLEIPTQYIPNEEKSAQLLAHHDRDDRDSLQFI